MLTIELSYERETPYYMPLHNSSSSFGCSSGSLTWMIALGVTLYGPNPDANGRRGTTWDHLIKRWHNVRTILVHAASRANSTKQALYVAPTPDDA